MNEKTKAQMEVVKLILLGHLFLAAVYGCVQLTHIVYQLGG